MIISRWPQTWKVFSIVARRTITIWRPKGLRTPLPRDVEFTRLGFKAAVWWRNDVRPTTASWTPIRWKCATIVDGDVVRTKRLHSGKDIWNPFIAICRTAFERIEAGSKSPLPRQTIFQAIKPVQSKTELKSKLRRKWQLVIRSCKLTQNKGQNPKRPQWTQWNPRIFFAHRKFVSTYIRMKVWTYDHHMNYTFVSLWARKRVTKKVRALTCQAWNWIGRNDSAESQRLAKEGAHHVAQSNLIKTRN